MNLDTNSPKKKDSVQAFDMDMEDFDFKPITSGLGFHHPKTSEIKPIFVDRPQTIVRETRTPKVDNQVYQNDLSLFYGKELFGQNQAAPVPEIKEEKIYRVAQKADRILAFSVDFLFLLSIMGIILTAMAKAMDMDLLVAWNEYPNEITPLALTLFSGFYLMYFSIFEKAESSTLGKNFLRLRVVDVRNASPSFTTLIVRTFVTLMNFVSLGLFSYFDLQNKVTDTKVIKAE